MLHGIYLQQALHKSLSWVLLLQEKRKGTTTADENENSIAHWLSQSNLPLLDPLRTATSLSTVSCVPAGESVVLGLWDPMEK
jgi:hypothetical protein